MGGGKLGGHVGGGPIERMRMEATHREEIQRGKPKAI